MNTIKFTLRTKAKAMIEEMKYNKVPIMEVDENTYKIVIPVCCETKLYDFIADLAEDCEATVEIEVFYQDPGTGESSRDITSIVNGKFVD